MSKNIILLVLWKVITTTEAANSCPVSIQTIQPVPSCPVTEEGWKKRAAIKNCIAYADQCDEPNRLEYHCVNNPFINETIEVCAYAQNIVGGYCAEYSRLGNLIQSNYKSLCQTCQFYYRSNEAFKYPACYEKEMTTAATNSPDTHSYASNSNVSETNMNITMQDDLQTLWIIMCILVAAAVFTVLVIVICWRKRREKCFKCCKSGGADKPRHDSEEVIRLSRNGILA